MPTDLGHVKATIVQHHLNNKISELFIDARDTTLTPENHDNCIGILVRLRSLAESTNTMQAFVAAYDEAIELYNTCERVQLTDYAVMYWQYIGILEQIIWMAEQETL